MFILLIFYGLLFATFGYFCKIFTENNQLKSEEEFYYKLKRHSLKHDDDLKLTNIKSDLILLKSKEILIPTDISNALQEIFDFIFAKFINNWYTGFSNNEDFIVELKYFFHIVLSQFYLRVSKIKIEEVVREKCLPIMINHFDICRTIYKSLDPESAATAVFQDQVLQRTRTHLHTVMISRAEEVHYLRSISALLVQKIVPNYITLNNNKICIYLLQEFLISTVLLPSMDTIASPDVINKMICLSLQSRQPQPSLQSDEITKVPILHRYQQAWLQRLQSSKNHPKGIELFLRNERYFYHFLQYLKFIKTVPFINFFKQMDSITLKLLDPDLNTKQKQMIHSDLQQLNVFLQSNNRGTTDELLVSSALFDRINEIIAGGLESVTDLITCPIWMENYNALCQHALNVYLPLYYESEEFLSTIYRDKNTSLLLNENFDPKSRRKEFYKAGTERTLRNSISFHREGSLEQLSESVSLGSGEHYLQSTGGILETIVDAGVLNSSSASSSPVALLRSSYIWDLPNVALLRVRIHSISQRNMDKNELTFTIYTYKIDSEDIIARVYRKYADFYVLEQKLAEFHGKVGRSLPGRRILEMKKLDYLDKCKSEFETYLMFLINRPFLKNSELLYNFLTKNEIEFSSNNLVDLNIGRFVKSVPMKLAAKKGQFLEPFLANYQNSCLQTSSSSSTNDHEESSMSKSSSSSLAASSSSHNLSSSSNVNSLIINRMHLKHYWNNASILKWTPQFLLEQNCNLTSRCLFSFYDVVCHLLDTIFGQLQLVNWLLHNVIYRLRGVLMPFCDIWCVEKLHKSIKQLTNEKTASDLIRLLRDTVFISTTVRSNSEKSHCRQQAHQHFIDIVTKCYLDNFLSNQSRQFVESELNCLFTILQQPKLNKQLSYLLLDVFLQEMFPELLPIHNKS